jgi:hypothetical protein
VKNIMSSSNNPYGRPAGTKNQRGHGAGGARTGAGRPSNYDTSVQQWVRERQETDQAADRARERAASDARLAAKLRQIETAKDKNHEDALKVLRSLSASESNDVSEREEEEGNDDQNEEEDADSRKYKRAAYMPPEKSCLFTQMKNIEEKWKKSPAFTAKDRMWYQGNSKDPVASNANSPEAWYKSKFDYFVWMPMDMFGTSVDLGTLKCIHGCEGHGGNAPNIKKHGSFAWRPMFCMDSITWVLHQRLECCQCKKTFTTIDPAFLPQLPTRVVERFPFFTSKRGPGIHQSIIFHFISLVGKGIMYGSYVNSINEIHRIRYSMESISYYDAVAEVLECSEANGGVFAPRVSV